MEKGESVNRAKNPKVSLLSWDWIFRERGLIYIIQTNDTAAIDSRSIATATGPQGDVQCKYGPVYPGASVYRVTRIYRENCDSSWLASNLVNDVNIANRTTETAKFYCRDDRASAHFSIFLSPPLFSSFSFPPFVFFMKFFQMIRARMSNSLNCFCLIDHFEILSGYFSLERVPFWWWKYNRGILFLFFRTKKKRRVVEFWKMMIQLLARSLMYINWNAEILSNYETFSWNWSNWWSYFGIRILKEEIFSLCY